MNSSKSMNETRIIVEELNPHETFTASLEEDGRTIYLYLSPVKNSNIQPRAVWVRNILPAPIEPDRQAMQNGQAPLLIRSACDHPEGGETIDPSQADLVWFQEGSGLSLMVDGKPEAVIPPWSGKDNIYGYARHALALDAGTLPLADDNRGLLNRIDENLKFWNLRTQKGFWDNFRDRMIAHYEKSFGAHSRYFALKDRQFPIIGILEFMLESEGVLYATVGMSAQHMPGVELSRTDPEKYFRAELLCVRSRKEDWFPGLMGRMAVYPWLSGTWLGPGHSFESGLNEIDSDFIFSDVRASPMDKVSPLIQDEQYHVNFLAAYGVSQDQMLAVRARGSGFILKRLLGDRFRS